MASDRFPIEAGHVLMFARSIGDDNRIYSDEEYAKESECGSIIAPPTFVQASAQFNPNYGLRPKTGGIGWMGSGAQPSGLMAKPNTEGDKSTEEKPKEQRSSGGGGGGLHAEQRYVYHRHPQVGDVLTSTTKPGNTWEKQGRRSGKLVFSESVTEYRDQNGELVVTATSVGVRTERPVDQK